ncbi:STM4015 family protein [Chitinophaga rhizophila]|uniref:STM4015 family protein n=1 Tax=Chitinophaga rhizophila TaxID=2866212 RepID=A0ABS7G696_9BACT|nr:STM4015 family protein [Chitinophaga rhizophila]MBW8683167.1 STM4015 family protein [Chitinophaga rhizophila]
MTIASNLNEFLGKRVENFNPETGIVNPETVVYRINTDYDEAAQEFDAKLDAFANDARVGEVTQLIIGMFDQESSTTTESLVNKLVSFKDKLQQLTHLFIGDITYQECEISWIQQSDMSPLLAAFPQLEYFRVRGGDGLRITAFAHANLNTLIIETGGLGPDTLKDIMAADLPKLEKLELWLGSENYGFASTVEDYATIISGEKFPGLKSLGLKNSEIQDEIAIALSTSPFVKQLDVLDLSMGVLSDKGGEALLNSPAVKELSFLDLRHHYLSNEMMGKLQSLGIKINLDEQETADKYGPYIEVSE